jgi:hypothetical protein
MGPIRKGKHWRMRRIKRTQEILQGDVIVKFLKSLRLRWYGHVERMQDRRTPKHVVTATKEETRRVDV